MMNLQLIEDQPRWRVWLVANFAKLIGVCIHVEGIPFGSSRSRKPKAGKYMDGAAGAAPLGKAILKAVQIKES